MAISFDGIIASDIQTVPDKIIDESSSYNSLLEMTLTDDLNEGDLAVLLVMAGPIIVSANAIGTFTGGHSYNFIIDDGTDEGWYDGVTSGGQWIYRQLEEETDFRNRHNPQYNTLETYNYRKRVVTPILSGTTITYQLQGPFNHIAGYILKFSEDDIDRTITGTQFVITNWGDGLQRIDGDWRDTYPSWSPTGIPTATWGNIGDYIDPTDTYFIAFTVVRGADFISHQADSPPDYYILEHDPETIVQDGDDIVDSTGVWTEIHYEDCGTGIIDYDTNTVYKLWVGQYTGGAQDSELLMNFATDPSRISNSTFQPPVGGDAHAYDGLSPWAGGYIFGITWTEEAIYVGNINLNIKFRASQTTA